MRKVICFTGIYLEIRGLSLFLFSCPTCICEDEMKESLKPGIKYEHKFKVPLSKTVPALYLESEEFVAMPEVFATGFLVGFLEWACIKAINPHLDWPKEQSV